CGWGWERAAGRVWAARPGPPHRRARGERGAAEAPRSAGLVVGAVVRDDPAAVVEGATAGTLAEVEGVSAPFVIRLPLAHGVHHDERGMARIVADGERHPPLDSFGGRDELVGIAAGRPQLGVGHLNPH